jgi:DNA-binding MarR family transcriptional regulator
MSSIVDDVVAFFRLFSSLEREEICCGTVTRAQCILLQTLMEGRWDVSGLAAEARVTKSAMTRLVDGLEARGWVRRIRDGDDARRVWVELTSDGKGEASRLARLTERSVNAVLERVPAGEREQVVRSMGLLRRAAEEARSALDCC